MPRSLSEAGRVAELDGRLAALRADRSAVWGVMNAQQMLTHLRDAMTWASDGRVLRAELSPLGNVVGRWFIFSSGIPWPRNVPTMRELDLRGKPLPDGAEFDAELLGVRAQVAEFAVLDPSRLSAVHPFFGPMTHELWMRWAYLHADHHLRQFGLV